jgi:hypothetical protein
MARLICAAVAAVMGYFRGREKPSKLKLDASRLCVRSRETVCAMNENWYEIWADEGHDVPYILMLRSNSQGFEILDPKEDNRKVFESRDYEGAKHYLLEDEFVRVGRKELDD